MKKPFFLTLSRFKQPLTKYCSLFFGGGGGGRGGVPEEQTRLRQRFLSKDYVLITQTTKVAHIITFLSGHTCLSTWAGAIQKRKVSLVIVIAPENKISKASNELHQIMTGNKLMTALVTLKAMTDSRVPEVVH